MLVRTRGDTIPNDRTANCMSDFVLASNAHSADSSAQVQCVTVGMAESSEANADDCEPRTILRRQLSQEYDITPSWRTKGTRKWLSKPEMLETLAMCRAASQGKSRWVSESEEAQEGLSLPSMLMHCFWSNPVDLTRPACLTFPQQLGLASMVSVGFETCRAQSMR